MEKIQIGVGLAILVVLLMINSSLGQISERIEENTVYTIETAESVQGLPFNLKNNGF